MNEEEQKIYEDLLGRLAQMKRANESPAEAIAAFERYMRERLGAREEDRREEA